MLVVGCFRKPDARLGKVVAEMGLRSVKLFVFLCGFRLRTEPLYSTRLLVGKSGKFYRTGKGEFMLHTLGMDSTCSCEGIPLPANLQAVVRVLFT